VRRGPALLLFIAIGLATWALHSYWTGGFVYVLFTGTPDQGPWLERVREVVASWGPLAPVVYTLAVVVEVIVAPIPGTLLYAPAGAIFGGFVGGSLSLVGNVAGAAICAVIGRMIGEGVLARRIDGSELGRYRTLLEQRGMWLVLLLRLNPLTTSDLVSYAAGVTGVPAWKVALGTFFGLAPWCYAQAYLAEQVFEVVPGTYLVLGGVALIIIAIGVVLTQRGRGASAEALRAKADSTGTASGDSQL
jgi:uncharacterized membrane protein YdjX (TVP38/TMEM64 family)